MEEDNERLIVACYFIYLEDSMDAISVNFDCVNVI